MDLGVVIPKYLGMEIARKPYPSDVSDDEWALVAPYLACCPKTPASASIRCVKSSTACATSSRPVRNGARCRTICRLGRGLSASAALAGVGLL